VKHSLFEPQNLTPNQKEDPESFKIEQINNVFPLKETPINRESPLTSKSCHK
jgi:hypothetical protein